MAVANHNLSNLAQRYQRQDDVEPQYSGDSCTDVGLNGAIVPLYDWNGAAILCQERLHRMRMLYNKRHQTIPRVPTLCRNDKKRFCRDGVYSVNCLDEDSHGSSHLPCCVRIRRGLRLSVVLRRHGQQMFTAWKVDEPRDASQNNRLIEACTINRIKWGYLVKYYKQMLENIAKI